MSRDKVLKMVGGLLIASPFLFIAIYIPTVTNSWDAAGPGYALGLLACGAIALGVFLVTRDKNA